jgi:hypothetical protein
MSHTLRSAHSRWVSLTLVTALVASCSAGADSEAGPGSSPPSTSVAIGQSSLGTAVASTALPGSTAPPVDTLDGPVLGNRFQYQANLVELGRLVYDAETSTAWLGVRVTNISDRWSVFDGSSVIDIDGALTNGFTDALNLPPGVTADVTLEYGSLTGNPVTNGVLRWGSAGLAQPTVELSSATLTDGDEPRMLPLEGSAAIGKHAIQLNGLVLQSASLAFGVQAPVGERVLRVQFDEFTSAESPIYGFAPKEHLQLVRPDGTTVDPVGGNDGYTPVSWTVWANNWVEFPVDDDPVGDYELLLNSVVPTALGTTRPDLIERVGVPFSLTDQAIAEAPTRASTTGVTALGEASAIPEPIIPANDPTDSPSTSPSTTQSALADEPLDVGTMNVPGFLVTPTAVSFDPNAGEVRLRVDVTSIEPDSSNQAPVIGADGDPVEVALDQAAGVLATDPQFFTEILLVGNNSTTPGYVDGTDAFVAVGTTESMDIVFGAVRNFDLASAGLAIGRRSGAASTLPLGPDSRLPAHPALPETLLVDAEPVTADTFTISLRTARLGLLQSTYLARAGERQLELTVDVSVPPDVPLTFSTSSFRGSQQMFIEGAGGWLIQPTGAGGIAVFEPGQTRRVTVTWNVPESFQPGPIRLVLRGIDEAIDITPEPWTETSFTAVLGGNRNTVDEAEGGLS